MVNVQLQKFNNNNCFLDLSFENQGYRPGGNDEGLVDVKLNLTLDDMIELQRKLNN